MAEGSTLLQNHTSACPRSTIQDACGAQPLVTLFEGLSLRYGAAIVDVQTATITFASWQVCWVVRNRNVPCAVLLNSASADMAVLVARMPLALLHPLLLQEADTQRSMLRALLLTADPAEVCLLASDHCNLQQPVRSQQQRPIPCSGGRTAWLCEVPSACVMSAVDHAGRLCPRPAVARHEAPAAPAGPGEACF